MSQVAVNFPHLLIPISFHSRVTIPAPVLVPEIHIFISIPMAKGITWETRESRIPIPDADLGCSICIEADTDANNDEWGGTNATVAR